jgi:MYXO-CTERM domain-containing protein
MLLAGVLVPVWSSPAEGLPRADWVAHTNQENHLDAHTNQETTAGQAELLSGRTSSPVVWSGAVETGIGGPWAGAPATWLLESMPLDPGDSARAATGLPSGWPAAGPTVSQHPAVSSAAVIPAPGGLGILGLVLLAGRRRRRRAGAP